MLGRADDIFKSSGTKVFPQKVKQELMKLNLFKDIFIFKGYINNYGNVPFCAYSSYKKLNITFVNNKLKKKLTMEQIPKKYFWYRDLPRLGNNKIDIQKIIKNCYEKSK